MKINYRVSMFLVLAATVSLDSVPKKAEGAFLSSTEVKNHIKSLSVTLKEREDSSLTSSAVQSENYEFWANQLINLKDKIFKSDGSSTCSIRVEQQNRGDDQIYLAPTLVDSHGNSKPLPELGLTIFKQLLSRENIKGENTFICENYTRRSDFSGFLITKNKTPQLHGIIHEKIKAQDIFENSITEKSLRPKSETKQYVGFTLNRGESVEGIPNYCYFQIQSESLEPSRILNVSEGNCYLVNYLKGKCTFSPHNEVAGIYAENNNTFDMESVLATDKLLPLLLDSVPRDGLYRLNEDNTLSALDGNLKAMAHVPPIEVQLEGSFEQSKADFSERKNAKIESIAEIFNNNQFLTSIDMGNFPFDEKFSQFLTEEARQRLTKVVLNDVVSLDSTLIENENEKIYPNLNSENIFIRGNTHRFLLGNHNSKLIQNQN